MTRGEQLARKPRTEAPGRSRPRSAPRRARLGAGLHGDDYAKRLDFELDVIIERMEFPGLLPDRRRLHQVGEGQRHPRRPGPRLGRRLASSPGRSTITDLDPLRFGLLFERFLNPERVSMPDFDIDFCQERRDEVIRYVQEQVRRRPRRADHHLRQAAGARRAARRRPRAADAATARSTTSASWCPTTRPTSRWRRRSRASRSCRRRATASRCRAPVRDRAEARGALPPCLDPRRRRGDRRPAAGRAVPLYRDPQVATCRSRSST